MITVTYTSRRHEKGAPVLERYVRRAIGADHYEWCEVGADRRWDLRQGTCGAEDLPANIRVAADEARTRTYAYVDWPLRSD